MKKRVLAISIAAIMLLTMLPVIPAFAAPVAIEGGALYEAEDAKLTGSARIIDAPQCSGGKKVGWIGNGGELLFEDVQSGDTGTYKMTLYYLCEGGRPLSYSVNGGAAVSCGSLNAGSFDRPAAADFQIPLNAGANTIRFFVPSGYGPDIDKIEVFAPDNEPPTAPANLTASAVTQTSVTLNWNASTDNIGVLGYCVYRDGTEIAFVKTTTYKDDSASPSTAYVYTVKARDGAGNLSAPSNAANVTTKDIDVTPPTVPGNLRVVDVTDVRVDLAWNPSTDNEGVAGYEVYRDGEKIADVDVTAFTETRLKPETTYVYNVLAVDTSGNKSTPSNTVTVTTKAPVAGSSNDRIAVPGGVPPFFYSPKVDPSLKARSMTEGIVPVNNPLRGTIRWFGVNDSPWNMPTPLSMEWKYFGLGDVMTGPNEFDWEAMEFVFDQMAAHGNQCCLRILTNQVSMGQNIKEIPDFLSDLTRTDGNLPYDNPRVMEAFTNFIKAFGEKYDGDPRIGFIHMGLVGKWGEWHTWPWQGGSNGNRNLMPSRENCEILMQAYDEAFDITRIEIRYPIVEGSNFSADLGRMGYHDDSFTYREQDPDQGNQVLSMTLPLSMGGKMDGFVKLMVDAGAENKWITGSIGGEVRPEVQNKFPQGASGDHDDTAECIEVAHATWMMCHSQNWPVTDTAAMNMIRKMGYNLHLKTAYFNDTAAGTMKVGVQIENTGVAPFYYGPETWPVLLCLKDGGGNIVKSWKTNWDLREVKPGKTRALPEWGLPGNPKYIDMAEPYYFDGLYNIANVPLGEYTVCVRVENPLENYPRELIERHWDYSKIRGDAVKLFYFANSGYSAGSNWLPLGNITVTDDIPEPDGQTVIMRIDELYASVNGEKVRVNDAQELAPIFNDDGRTMVPFRFIATCFGAEVDWDEGLGSAIIDYNGKHIQIPINESFAFVDGVKTPINAPAQIMTFGRTFVPFRAVSELLGDINLEYDPGSMTIIASDGDIDVQKCVADFDTLIG